MDENTWEFQVANINRGGGTRINQFIPISCAINNKKRIQLKWSAQCYTAVGMESKYTHQNTWFAHQWILSLITLTSHQITSIYG